MKQKTNLSGKQICFALLVHNNKNVVIDLLNNIKFYCPNSTVVLYNGGDNPDLCKDLGSPVCPTSRKLQYGVTAVYLLETMKWLEDINHDYDYLINLDSDALFVREGYERFIAEQMEDKDYMGVETKPLNYNTYCGIQLKKEFSLWKPIFGTRTLYESFNVGQVFSKRLVNRFIESEQFEILLDNLKKTKAFGIDEIVYVSMTKILGFKLNAYPTTTGNSIRYRPYFPLDETFSLLHTNKECYLLHPVHRDMKDETRLFINSRLKQKIQFYPAKRKRLLDQDLGNMPLLIHKEINDSGSIEWMTASLNAGITYWKAPQSGSDLISSSFGNEKVHSFSAIESHDGNIEAICRSGHRLFHYSWNESKGKWLASEAFANGVVGTPMFIESSYGNFEVVAPLESGGLGHWYRNNSHPDRPWVGPIKFGQGVFHKGFLVQNNAQQLTVIVKMDDGYRYFVRDDGESWEWFGPFI